MGNFLRGFLAATAAGYATVSFGFTLLDFGRGEWILGIVMLLCSMAGALVSFGEIRVIREEL